MIKINKDMIIGDVIRENINLMDTFADNGMHCVGCPSAQMESIEDACIVHGLDVNILIKALNKENKGE
ncbi:MAG: DUF1858 domain-containing protein [Fusobacterium sp.]